MMDPFHSEAARPSPSTVEDADWGERSPVCWICRSGESDEPDAEGHPGHGADGGGEMDCGRAAEPLVRDRCCCRGAFSVVHQSCINRWVIEADHRSCGLCGASYSLVAAGVKASFLGDPASARWQLLHRWLGPWLLYIEYAYRLLDALLECAWHVFARFVLFSVLLHACYGLPPVLLMLLQPRGRVVTLVVAGAVAVYVCCHRPLLLVGCCCHGWLAQLAGWYLRHAWQCFRYPHAVREREAERRRWRESVNQLPWAGRWLETAYRWRRYWTSPLEWPQWEVQFDVLVACVWGYVGAVFGAAAAALLFCCPEYHQPPCPPLLFHVDMEVVGVDLFDEEANHPHRRGAAGGRRELAAEGGEGRADVGGNAHRDEDGNLPRPHHQEPQQPQQPQPRPLNQSRRRRFGRQNRIRHGAYRTCVVVRGPVYAFMQRELVRGVHFVLAPLLTGMIAHVATSPVLSWKLDLGSWLDYPTNGSIFSFSSVYNATGASAPALFSSMTSTAVFAAVPPSPFEALVCLGAMLRDVALGRRSLGSLALLLCRGLYRTLTFPLGWLDVVGYWSAGLVVLWAATVLVVRPLIRVTMATRLVTGRLGFCVTHPLDVAAVDRLVEFGWVRNNQRRERMGGSSVLAWSEDTLLRVLPRETWRALCRCLTCLLLLLVGTSLVVGSRLGLERSGLIQSYTAAPGASVAAMEAEPLPLWRLPAVAALHARAEPNATKRGVFCRNQAACSELTTDMAFSPSQTATPSKDEYTDAFGFTADTLREAWHLAPAVRASVWQFSVDLAALSDDGRCDAARNGSVVGATRPCRRHVPWAEWVLTALLLLWCALFLETYPWHYYWLKRLLPLYHWWGRSVLRLPTTGPRSVFCDGQQGRRLARWLRACERRAGSATTTFMAPGPQLYHAVDTVLGWNPIRGDGAAGSAGDGYPHRLRIHQELNRNDNEPSLARYAQGVRAKQREAKRRLRAEERAEAAERRRRQQEQRRQLPDTPGPVEAGDTDHDAAAQRTKDAVPAARARHRRPPPPPREEEQRPPPPPRPRPARHPFTALPVRHHRTFGDWLYGEIRAHFPSRQPRAHKDGKTPASQRQRGVAWRGMRRVRQALTTPWYELRVALFVTGALLGTATYLGCVLALAFAVLMDVLPSCLLLVGLCGMLGAAVASPYVFVVTMASFCATPCMVAVLLGLEARGRLWWLWRLLSGAPEHVQAVALALRPARLDVGPYRRPTAAEVGGSALGLPR